MTRRQASTRILSEENEPKIPKVPASPASTSSSWDALERISKICAQVSVVVGVVVGLYGCIDSLERVRLSAQAAKLQSLTYIQAYIKEDFAIQTCISRFDYAQLRGLEAKAMEKPGRNLYFSKDELGDVAVIGEHYEDMGAELRNGYLDFKLLYDIVPFPDEFWERTRNLRSNLRANWGGKDLPLNDLWSNFGYLCELYRTQRGRDDEASHRNSIWSIFATSPKPKVPEPVRINVALCRE